MSKPPSQPPILEYHRERLVVKALPFTHHNLQQCLEFTSPHVDRYDPSLIVFKKLPWRTKYQHSARPGQIIIRDQWGRCYSKWPEWFHEHFKPVHEPIPAAAVAPPSPPPIPKPAQKPSLKPPNPKLQAVINSTKAKKKKARDQFLNGGKWVSWRDL